MNPKPHFRITKKLLKELCGASARERFLHRLHCVVLVLNGLSSSEVSRIYDDSPRAVAYWVTRFKRSGVEGLSEETRPGRPSKLNGIQTKLLQTFVHRSEKLSKPVNAEDVSAFILKKFQISLTPRQCWRILNRLRS